MKKVAIAGKLSLRNGRWYFLVMPEMLSEELNGWGGRYRVVPFELTGKDQPFSYERDMIVPFDYIASIEYVPGEILVQEFSLEADTGIAIQNEMESVFEYTR